jgi:hypothetical protein
MNWVGLGHQILRDADPNNDLSTGYGGLNSSERTLLLSWVRLGV